MLIILYSGVLRLFIDTKTQDPLVAIRSPILGNFLNGWTGTHFVFFAYLGYRYPSCFEEAMILGTLWELLELTVGELLPAVAPQIAYRLDPFWMSWYYGCYEDIVANAVGFQTGKLLRRIYNTKNGNREPRN